MLNTWTCYVPDVLPCLLPSEVCNLHHLLLQLLHLAPTVSEPEFWFTVTLFFDSFTHTRNFKFYGLKFSITIHTKKLKTTRLDISIFTRKNTPLCYAWQRFFKEKTTCWQGWRTIPPRRRGSESPDKPRPIWRRKKTARFSSATQFEPWTNTHSARIITWAATAANPKFLSQYLAAIILKLPQPLLHYCYEWQWKKGTKSECPPQAAKVNGLSKESDAKFTGAPLSNNNFATS